MIQDLALRWIVTLLFLFSAGVCVQALAANRHSGANLISHSLHAIMAIAMAVMAWPRGAELPTRGPMIFFFAAALWFAVVTLRSADHRPANLYHTFMMLAMAWMYAAMGGLPVRRSDGDSMPGMDMPGMPGMDGGRAGHGGHAGHSAAASATAEGVSWYGALNWLCTIAFGLAAVFFLYRFITARLQSSGHSSHNTVGILCQCAMAAGMAIMFAVML